MDSIEEKQTKIHPLISLAITVIGVAILIFLVAEKMDAVRAFIGGSGWVGLVVSIALYGLLGLSPIPSEPLTVLLGTVYGPLAATFVAGTGNLLAAVMEYLIGERIANVTSFESRRQRLPFGLGKFPVDSVPFLLVARMLPGYGPKFVSLMAGVYRVPMRRYLWTAAIPTFLGSAIFAFGGSSLFHLFPGRSH